MLFHCFLAARSLNKLMVSLNVVAQYIMYHFPLAAFKIYLLSLVFCGLTTTMYSYVLFFRVALLGDLWDFWIFNVKFFSNLGNFHYFYSNIFSVSFSCILLWLPFCVCLLGLFILSNRSQSSFFFFQFCIFCSSYWIISVDLT